MAEGSVPITGKPLQNLVNAFLADEGDVLLTEHTLAVINGLKIEVFSNEHQPPHFRVTCGDESNDFRIDNCSPMYDDGLKKKFKVIRKWHTDNKDALIAAWNKTRPAGCPVGEYKAPAPEKKPDPKGKK